MTRKKSQSRICYEDRTTSLGFFYYAEAYWSATKTLQEFATKKYGHWEAPVRFLYYHAIELYLKSFLRARNQTLDDLRKLGHLGPRLIARVEEFGWVFDDEDRVVFGALYKDNIVNRSRYIQADLGTVATTWPALEALDRTCVSLGVVPGKRFSGTVSSESRPHKS